MAFLPSWSVISNNNHTHLICHFSWQQCQWQCVLFSLWSQEPGKPPGILAPSCDLSQQLKSNFSKKPHYEGERKVSRNNDLVKEASGCSVTVTSKDCSIHWKHFQKGKVFGPSLWRFPSSRVSHTAMFRIKTAEEIGTQDKMWKEILFFTC